MLPTVGMVFTVTVWYPMGKYIPLAVRQANRAKIALEQAKVDIAKLHEVERLMAKVMAMPDAHTHEGAAPNYDGGSKPVKYSLWKRFVSALSVGYVPVSEMTQDVSVQVYCVHCGLPTDVNTVKRIAIGVITEYDEIETTVVPVGNSWDWDEEEVTRIRPAIHKGDGCPACAYAYMKAEANAKRLTTRIRFSVDGVKKTLYAASINHGASLLAEHMGRVELIDCKTIPVRQAFLNVRVRVAEFTPDPKLMAKEYEQRAQAMARLQATQERTDAIMARVLAENLQSKRDNRRRTLKGILKANADRLPVRNWLRVATVIQNWEATA